MNQTYIPLYRKYRPQTFQDLIGQEHISQALSNAIKLNKVSHAYLFCGPRGTGKTSSARIFAKSLNCENGPTIEPCGKCPSCIDITNTTPVDVIEIDAASNRSVEDAQNILEKIQYVPIHGKYKIYIIDEVHMLSPTAFNALLKTLEEPPENVVFILATTEAHKVLETIVSRCQRFDFRRITVDDIVKRLEFISEKENINISKDALLAIAKSAQGGMRDALALLDQLSILDVQKQIDVQDVENLLGKISPNVLFDLTEKITSNNPQDAIIEINKIYAKGNEPLQIVSNLIEYFRNLLIIKTCNDKETILTLTQLNDDLFAKIEPQAKKLDTSVINYVIDRLATYLREIKNSTDRYLWLEVCMIELSNKLSVGNFSDIFGRIDALEKAVMGGGQFVAPKPQIQIQPQQIKQEPKTQAQQDSPSQPVKTEEKQAPSEVPTDAHVDAVVAGVSDMQPVAANKIEEKKEEVEQKSQNTPAEPQTIVNTASSDEDNLWQALLAKFSSLPSKMFFSNLSSPICISKDKIVIGFSKEVFVKQSKEAGRMTPLKDAISQLFGNADMPIEIRLISETEAEEAKKKTDTVKTATAPIQPKAPSVAQEQKTEDEENDEDFYNEQLAQAQESKHPTPPTHSDQAKMILDLFNGKYMD